MDGASSGPILRLLSRAVGGRRAEAASDEELLRRFTADRDEGCFHALLRRHGPMVFGVCRAVLRNEADAEDAFQATFLVLARHAGSVRAAGSLCAWLHGVAYRTALRARADFARRRKHEGRVPPPGAAAPEDLSWREAQLVLHEELGRLGEGYRAPLVLCYLQGETQDEAARLLGLPKGTLKGRLERGRALLRQRLARRGLAPESALVMAAWPLAATSACLAGPAAAAARAAALLAAGGSAAGVVPGRVIQLSEGVMRAMYFTKVKVAVTALVACAAALAVALVAAGQRPGAGTPEKEAARPPAAGAKVQARALPPEALAAHLGVVHKTFELTFPRPQAEVTLSIDVYENGKRTVKGEEVASRAVAGKHACSVLFSRGKEEGKLVITVVTSVGTYNEVIDDPFGGPGLIYPGPRMDAEGRIPLALKAAKVEGTPTDISKVNVATAAKALVVQVRKK